MLRFAHVVFFRFVSLFYNVDSWFTGIQNGRPGQLTIEMNGDFVMRSDRGKFRRFNFTLTFQIYKRAWSRFGSFLWFLNRRAFRRGLHGCSFVRYNSRERVGLTATTAAVLYKLIINIPCVLVAEILPYDLFKVLPQCSKKHVLCVILEFAIIYPHAHLYN